mmetsp:Transcript_117404/g.262418  ORF Transcript_117404/g.262418 Transcript_117404/m.262418 type:complete len:242 (-) Transcript_117404:26-751(-)|eukprot:CAMPEP_0180770828 /NCGR_PEP_ID=MMETSP1038_2-20121128/41843_1 /TAXON_ID=632150 /ORGANISM="Azadinium spinosum, Strain 3D9" /LENGTH=241 /DNA_ID=CAMNT_0022805645 /DNA_START=93 /DNA_END=818 /DNA_ORIENTATION=+
MTSPYTFDKQTACCVKAADATLVHVLRESGGMSFKKLAECIWLDVSGGLSNKQVGKLKKYVRKRPSLFSVRAGIVTLKAALLESSTTNANVICRPLKAAPVNRTSDAGFKHEESDDCPEVISSEDDSIGDDRACGVEDEAEMSAPTGKRKHTESLSSGMGELEDWLLGLDKGRGALLSHKDALVREFDGDLFQISSAWVGADDGQSLVNAVDPFFWTAIGVHVMGHKLLFAQGIAALQRQK